MKYYTHGYTSRDTGLCGNFISIIAQRLMINFYVISEVETLVPLKIYLDAKLYKTSTKLWLWGRTKVSTSSKRVNSVH